MYDRGGWRKAVGRIELCDDEVTSSRCLDYYLVIWWSMWLVEGIKFLSFAGIYASENAMNAAASSWRYRLYNAMLGHTSMAAIWMQTSRPLFLLCSQTSRLTCAPAPQAWHPMRHPFPPPTCYRSWAPFAAQPLWGS